MPDILLQEYNTYLLNADDYTDEEQVLIEASFREQIAASRIL